MLDAAKATDWTIMKELLLEERHILTARVV
jgi:hypothetical protein